MKWFVVALLVGIGVPAWTEGNAYMELKAKLQAADARMQDVRQRIEKARVQHAEADTQMRRSVTHLVKVRQYPRGFWLVRSVVMDEPLQADVIEVVGRQQVRKMVKNQAEASVLATLYGQANSQLQSLREVQAAYKDAQGRLLGVEKQVLQRAGVQAEALEQGLDEALKAPLAHVKVPVVEAPVAAGGLPVAGRVVRGFGRGEGAAKAGVVLKAPEGAPVRATQAGRVLFAGPFRHFGGLVIVKTVRGEDVLLGGMDTLNVNAGNAVAVGQQLGTVGREGRIYWEMRKRGKVVNPL